MYDLCDITIYSEPGSATMRGKQSENGSGIHLLIIFHLRTLPDPKANLIQMVTDSWTCYQRALEDQAVSALDMNELAMHGPNEAVTCLCVCSVCIQDIK